MSSTDRDITVFSIFVAEFAEDLNVSEGLPQQLERLVWGRLREIWADRLLYGCGLIVGIVEGLWLRRRLESKGYHMILWTSAQACLVTIIVGLLVLVTLSSPLPYRVVAASAVAVCAWLGFATTAGFPRTL